MSNPIIYNMYTPTQYCSDTTSYNTYAADSAARWYMSQVDMTCNGWGGLYAFGEDMRWSQMLNIGAVADYSWNQVINGGNNIMSLNPWSQWGWNNNTTPTTPSTKKDDTPATEEEREAKEEYDQLKNLLKSFAEKVLKKSDDQGDKDLGDDILKAIKNSSKTTYREKCDELREFYDLVKGDLEEFIEENVTIKPFGGSATVLNYLMQIGNHADNTSGGSSNVAKGIRDQLAKVGEDNPNMDKLTNVDESNVIAVIGCYNDTDNFAKALQDAYNRVTGDANAADSAKTRINDVTDALKAKAKTIADKMDPDTKDKIERLAENLPEVTDVNFVKEFNKLYTMVRLSMAKLVDKELERKYGKIDSSFMHASADAIEDIKKELNKVSELNIDPEAIADDIKVKPGRSYTSARRTEESNRQLNEKDNEEKIEALTNGGADAILVPTGARCDGEEVYKEAHSLKPRYFILDEDGLFYEVDEQADGTYKVKDGAEGLQASDLKTAGERAKDREAAQKEIDDNLGKEDFPFTKVNDKTFTGTGDATTTEGYLYTIYKAEGQERFFILNNEGKLEEVVASTNGQYVKKSGVVSQTVGELKREINRAKDEANRERREKLTNPISDSSVLVADDVSIGRNRWCKTKNKDKNYVAGLHNALQAYKTNSSNGAYTDEEWNKAYELLIGYYTAVYTSLETMEDTNEIEGDGETTFGFSSWCSQKFRYARDHKGTHVVSQTVKGNGADNKYKDASGNWKTLNESSVVRINDSGDDVNSFTKVAAGQTSETGLYIGCDFDCSWRGFFGSGHKNDFYFYLDSATVFKKFKSFLPK